MSAKLANRICVLEEALRKVQAEIILIEMDEHDGELNERLNQIDTICNEGLRGKR